MDRRDSRNRILNKGEYQKADGRYAFRYTDNDGRERWIYSWKLVKTDKVPLGRDCEKSLRELEIDIQKALLDRVNSFDAERLTLNDEFEFYMATKVKLKDRTRAHYRYFWDRFVRDNLGRRMISSLRYSDIQLHFAKLMKEKGLRPNSLRNIYNLVHPVLEIAVRDDLIRKNPADGVLADVLKDRSSKTEKRHSLSEEQQEAFIGYLKSRRKYRRWYRLFIFLLGTGCRIGEARGLTWDDCDFENRVIFVNRQIGYYRGENEEHYSEHISDPKSESGIRTIPMFSAVRDVLLEERMIQEELGREEKKIGNVSGFIFQTRSGGCIDSKNVDGALYRLVDKYNKEEIDKAKHEGRDPILLPRFSVHNLRHTFCTRMCENETNLKVIQEVMGHADISTTMNIYAEAMEKKKKERFDHLEGKIVRG